MAIKGYSAFPKAPALLEPSPSDCLVSYQDTRWGCLTPLQRCSRCILQTQLTGHRIFKTMLDTNKLLLRKNYSSLKPSRRGRSSSVEAKMLDCNITVVESELQSHQYVHFRTIAFQKSMKPSHLNSYGLNNINTVLLIFILFTQPLRSGRI